MPVPMSDKRANLGTSSPLAGVITAVDVPVPHSPEPIDSYDPIVRLDW